MSSPNKALHKSASESVDYFLDTAESLAAKTLSCPPPSGLFLAPTLHLLSGSDPGISFCQETRQLCWFPPTSLLFPPRSQMGRGRSKVRGKGGSPSVVQADEGSGAIFPLCAWGSFTKRHSLSEYLNHSRELHYCPVF